MALTTVYNKRNTSRYMATTCSTALIFHWITVAVIVILPFVAAFYTRNLWISELTYREQPDVQFNYKIISLVHTSGSYNAKKTYLWSTFPVLNTLAQEILSVPMLSVQETDYHRDGKMDQLNITLQYPASEEPDVEYPASGITNIQVILFIQYKLSHLCDLVMESAIFIQQAVDGGRVVIRGDLELIQREVLKAYSSHHNYNSSLVTEDLLLESYQLSKILSTSSSRKLSTKLNQDYTLSSPGEGLTMTLLINIQEQLIRYEPGFWEALKYAWIQYLALFVIVNTIIQQLRTFVFENMIVITLPQIKDQ